jgi:hypothetical protein
MNVVKEIMVPKIREISWLPVQFVCSQNEFCCMELISENMYDEFAWKSIPIKKGKTTDFTEVASYIITWSLKITAVVSVVLSVSLHLKIWHFR